MNNRLNLTNRIEENLSRHRFHVLRPMDAVQHGTGVIAKPEHLQTQTTAPIRGIPPVNSVHYAPGPVISKGPKGIPVMGPQKPPAKIHYAPGPVISKKSGGGEIPVMGPAKCPTGKCGSQRDGSQKLIYFALLAGAVYFLVYK